MTVDELKTCLSPAGSRIVAECMQATATGPFFPDWEFETLFGLTRGEMQTFAGQWQTGGEISQDFSAAIVGSVNQLLGYPHGCDHALPDYVSASRPEMESVLGRLVEIGL